MPHIHTAAFGTLDYDPSSTLIFPQGLPGLPSETRFLPVSQPFNEPAVFLQSVSNPGLCFFTLPLRALVPDYDLRLTAEEKSLLGIDAAETGVENGLLALAIITIDEESKTPAANLLAPVVVNISKRRACQSVQQPSGYSVRESLAPAAKNSSDANTLPLFEKGGGAEKNLSC